MEKRTTLLTGSVREGQRRGWCFQLHLKGANRLGQWYHGDPEPGTPLPNSRKAMMSLQSAGFNWVCKKTPLVESNVWPQFQTYDRKIFSATQIAMGGVTGWCAGVLFQKVGKLAALAVSGGFLLLHIANHSGCVQTAWKRVEKDVNKAKKMKKGANKEAPEINTTSEEAIEFIRQNIVIPSGFVGGFLLGLAS